MPEKSHNAGLFRNWSTATASSLPLRLDAAASRGAFRKSLTVDLEHWLRVDDAVAPELRALIQELAPLLHVGLSHKLRLTVHNSGPRTKFVIRSGGRGFSRRIKCLWNWLLRVKGEASVVTASRQGIVDALREARSNFFRAKIARSHRIARRSLQELIEDYTTQEEKLDQAMSDYVEKALAAA